MTTIDTTIDMTGTGTAADIDIGTDIETPAAIEALAGRLFESALATIELFSVYVGLRLDLYQALAESPRTTDQLAARTGIHSRYAREWLEQQTVAGIVACHDRTAEESARVFSLPAGHATVLLDADHPACTSPVALAAAGVAGVLPELLDAYRTGGGVPYAHYGSDFRDGQAGFNRPAFVNLLAGDWLANGAPQVDARLRTSAAPRIAEIACGAGWASIALAQAYPTASVDGFDNDDASIADARRNAAGVAGVEGRVRFEVRDASTAIDGGAGRYDLVTIFEALHDMSHPVDALRTCRDLCAPDGSVLVMDGRAADTFADSDGPIERFLYGASVLHCLPVGMAEPGSAGTGTVMRLDTVRRYAAEAGFSDVAVLPIEHDLFRFYHLVP